MLAALLAIAAAPFDSRANEPAVPRYAGAASCRPCHEAAYAAWQGSDHDLAMQEATAATVLGDFANVTFEAGGVVSTFRKDGDRFVVRTDGPDGKLADYAVKYTFGVRPLQQYLVEFPGGRLQALPLAWDTRPKEAGGQRWFHLYPSEKLAPGDQLHWTGIYQNWNLQCAGCHSTDLRKNYDESSRRYATTWAEIDVACESCHGPGREHVEWAARAVPPYAAEDAKGLVVRLRPDAARAWRFPSVDARFAELDPKADRAAAATRMNTCAPCHARRSTLSEDGVPGDPLEDSHRLALLTDPLYFADGQQRDEVFTWGSFLQSRMFTKGVTCEDCHDPHGLKVRTKGNGLCAGCHNPSVFDAKTHHFHEPGSKGSACVDCHMPARNYMVIDGRRDHSLRVPRPDLAATTGAPDACSGCHAGRTPEWAAGAMDGWYGKGWRSRPEYGSTLRKASSEGAKSLAPLMALAADPSQPAVVRATAVDLASPVARPEALAPAMALLSDPDPSVRRAALALLEPFDAATRTKAAAALLSDPVLSVREEAVRLLADVPDADLPADRREARASARGEFLATLRRESDWPASLVSLGNFLQREGRGDEAVAAYRRAIEVDPRFLGGYVNLADALRVQGKEAEAGEVLARGLAALPDAASLHHARGLALVRQGDKAAALDELANAARLDPANVRFAYVQAVALNSMGRTGEALVVLEEADRRHPYDLDVLGALVSMNLEAGRPQAALPPARRIAEVMPEDAGIRGLVARLEAGN